MTSEDGEDGLEATRASQSRPRVEPRAPSPQPAPPTGEGADPMLGKVLAGKYRIERMIAKGGMGKVYLATQQPLERKVAVKVLHLSTEAAGDPQLVRRFHLEAAVCARLSHPNIVTVHDYGEAEDGQLYMAMELLAGKPLSTVIKEQGALPPNRLIPMALQMCRALRGAHALNIVHRDLKPGNIILLDPREDEPGDVIKVLDFGLVKVFEAEGAPPSDDGVELTRTGTLLGSPRFMSPEQIRTEALDARSDIYSLGAVLYNMAAGRPPYDGKTVVDVLHQHLNKPTPPIPGLHPRLMAVIERAMAKAREDRYPSVAEMMTELKAVYREIGPRGSMDPGPGGPPVREHPAIDASDSRPIPALQASPLVEGLSSTQPNLIADASLVSAKRPSVGLWIGLVLVALAAVAALALLRPAPAPISAPLVRAPRKLTVESSPSGATVREGGRVLGTTPLTLELDPAQVSARELELSLEGYLPTVLKQPPSEVDARLFATLAPVPAPSAPAPSAPAPSRSARPAKSAAPSKAPEPDIRLNR